jgi:hypothetical protein
MDAPLASEAGIALNLTIGQRVRHQDYDGKRVTGVVRSLAVDSERGLMVTIALDAPIVIPAGGGFGAINIHTQHAPVHEFAPFDERDELVAELLAACEAAGRYDDAITHRATDGTYTLDAGAAIAEGHDLDALYADWMTKVRAALAKAGAVA